MHLTVQYRYSGGNTVKKMHLFSIDESMNSYIYPVVKIVLCIVIILLLIFRGHFIQINQLLWDIIERVFCTALGSACILCIVISFAQLLVVHDNRSEKQALTSKQMEKVRRFPIEKIISLSRDNDIIEFKIVSKDMCLNIGASSDSKRGDSVFFDKLYYIGNREYDNLGSFMEELTKYSIDGQISVVSIDGVSPEYYQ